MKFEKEKNQMNKTGWGGGAVDKDDIPNCWVIVRGTAFVALNDAQIHCSIQTEMHVACTSYGVLRKTIPVQISKNPFR